MNTKPNKVIRYYLVKEVDGVIVRKTEIIHQEPRDRQGRYLPTESDRNITPKEARQARRAKCPKCGYEFLVA